MKSLKAIPALILFVLICYHPVFAQSVHVYLKPVLGISLPVSEKLKNYYNKDNFFTYGGILSLSTGYHDLGLYFGLNRYSIEIVDEYKSDIDETGTIYKIGVFKRFCPKFFIFDTKLGLTLRDDELARPGKDDVRLGFEIGFSAEKKISSRLGSYIEACYNFDKVEIPEYVTVQYSRHQKYLSGQNIQSGGILLQAGISILLF